MRIRISILLIVFITGYFQELKGQKKIIDQIVAVVGENMILQSDIEGQYIQYIAQGYRGEKKLKCKILEELMSQKLLLNQAKIDSIEINEGDVENELDRRMQYFISQLGSKEKVEEYYKKSTLEIKEDMRDIIRDQLITQQMQSVLIGDISISPSDVKEFYKETPKDSIPYVNSQIEVCQIAAYPPYSEEAKYDVREKLLSLRQRIINGENFATLAVLYSEEQGSAKNGGELGFMNRSDFVKDFADVAFTLKGDNVSKIVETEYGFHIIQLIERRENQINVRQILMKPNVSIEGKLIAKNKLDSIAEIIRKGEITFDRAAKIFSEDEYTRLNGGLRVNPFTGSSKFELSQLEPAESYTARDLKIGETSDPFESQDINGRVVYKIITVKSRSKPHKATLEEDYKIIQDMVRMSKRQEIINEWLKEKQIETYIHIDDIYKDCTFESKGWFK